MNNPLLKFGLPIALLGLAVVAYLAIAVFGVQTLFTDETVDEANPFAVETTAQSDAATETTIGDTADTEAPGSDGDNTPAEPVSETTEPIASDSTDDTSAEQAVEEPAVVEPAASAGPVTEATGMFIGLDHPAVGTALVISDPASGQRIVRFEDFETDNGPDLFVYLSAGVDATTPDHSLFDQDFLNLGQLTGNIGAQNYVLDPSVDITQYDTVVIWCDRFNVAFGAADLLVA